MAIPKLYYFDAPALAEPARVMFALSGKEFEDIRFNHEQWAQYKELSPTGMAPFLETEDGSKIVESVAVLTYVAKKTGMMPTDHVAEAKVMGIGFFVTNLYQAVRALYLAPEEERPTLSAKLTEEKIIPLVNTWEKLVKQTQTTPGYAYGDKFTFADAAIYAAFYLLGGNNQFHMNYTLDKAKTPTLAAIYDNVSKQKSVQDYVAKHKK